MEKKDDYGFEENRIHHCHCCATVQKNINIKFDVVTTVRWTLHLTRKWYREDMTEHITISAIITLSGR